MRPDKKRYDFAVRGILRVLPALLCPFLLLSCSEKEPMKWVDLRFLAEDRYELTAFDPEPIVLQVKSTDPWTVYGQHQDWCAISPAEGGPDELFEVTVTYTDNTGLDDRIDTLIIQSDYWIGKWVEVFQHGTAYLDFENAEGNLGVANAVFEHLASKLPISRMQRDLTDSTVLRNIGVPMAHTVIAFKSILKGLNKLIINLDAINQDLDNNWAVVAEGIQTILRREAYPNPYEALKALTRTNKPISKEDIKNFIEGLDVAESVKEELRRLTPHTYTGVCRY